MRYKYTRHSAVENLSRAIDELSLQDHDEAQPAAVASRPSSIVGRPTYRLAINLLLKSLSDLLKAGDYAQFEVTLKQTQLFSLLTDKDFGGLANVCNQVITTGETYSTVASLYVYLVFQLGNCALWNDGAH